MASLPPLTGYNLGGIDQFWFIAVDQVQSIPDEESNVIEQDIQLVGDAKFNVGYATQETLQFTENQNRDAQGNFYEQSLSGFYPKDQENIASLFEGMAAERFIVIFRDNNGYYKLLGSLANPCKFTATFESGDSANGRNGYSFEFTRTDVEKAPFYRGIINETEKVINTDPCAGLEKPVRQTYTLTFEPNSAKYNALTIEQQGTIQLIDAPSGTTVYKSTSSSPYQTQVSAGDNVDEGDIVTVELSSVPTSQVKVEVVVSYSDISVSKTLPEDLGGNGNWMYVLCFPDAAVSAVDLTNEAVTTISLPSEFVSGGNDINGRSNIMYRWATKDVLVVYEDGSKDMRLTVIDADPSSANFNTVISNNKIINQSFRGDTFIYDQINDRFFVGNGSDSGIYQIDGTKVRSIWNSSNFTNIGNHSYLTDYVSWHNVNTNDRPLVFRQFQDYLDKTKIINSNPVKSGLGRYNPVNGLWYWVTTGRIQVIEFETNTVIASMGGDTDRGDIAIDFTNNIGIPVDNSGRGNFGKINCSNNTYAGTENSGYSQPLGKPQYSPVTGLVYFPVGQTNKLIVVDPTNSVGNLKLREITIGNYDDQGSYNSKNYTAINQIML